MPTAPTLVSLTANNNNKSILVTYINTGAGDHNQILRSTPTEYAGAFIKIADPVAYNTATNQVYTDLNVASGVQYSYQIVAVDSGGATATSAASSLTAPTLAVGSLHTVNKYTGSSTVVNTASATSLTESLVAYWKLEEASGTRNDAVGTNHLTDNNTVTQATGKVGNAAKFTVANSEFLSIADNTVVSTGDIDFTIAGWFYLDSKTDYRGLLGKDNGVQQDYGIYYDLAFDRLIFYVFDNASNYAEVRASALGSPATGTWYFIVAWHDSVANTINIQINNGTVNSTSHSAGVKDSTAPFWIGRDGATYMDGRIDAVGFWKRILTTAEKTILYNQGDGLAHPFTLNQVNVYDLRPHNLSYELDKASYATTGATVQTVGVSAIEKIGLDLIIRIPNTTDATRILIRNMVTSRRYVCYRDTRGNKFFGRLQYGERYEPSFSDLAFRFMTTDFTEAVA